MEIHRFKQLRPKVVNNYTCLSQTDCTAKKISDEKKSNICFVNIPIHAINAIL